MDPVTRETLLRRLADRGDRQAWEQFFQIYAPLLFRYATSCGLTPVDAEEVRDQCLVILAAKLPEFRYDDSRGQFRGYLRRLARDTVVDSLRKRREIHRDPDTFIDVADPAPPPDEQWDRHWRDQHLLFCFEQVCRNSSPRDERVLRQLLADDVPVEKVCESFDLNANQVYKIKSRFLQRVREQMSALGEDP